MASPTPKSPIESDGFLEECRAFILRVSGEPLAETHETFEERAIVSALLALSRSEAHQAAAVPLLMMIRARARCTQTDSGVSDEAALEAVASAMARLASEPEALSPAIQFDLLWSEPLAPTLQVGLATLLWL